MAYQNNGEHLFILGSARSGTSLMASIVQSSPEFASYRAETKLLNSARAVYGDLANPRSNSRFWRDWFCSRQFYRTGLTEGEIRQATKSLDSYVAVLGAYMDAVAESQNCERWIDSTPDNVRSIKEIAEVFPRSKVIHMVRDGRAVALSLAKLGWSGGRTFNQDKALLYSALKWQRAINAMSKAANMLGGRYLIISYEGLVQRPDDTLKQVSEFLCIPALDRSVLDGDVASESESINSSLRTPNSPFGDVAPGLSSGAMYRWKTALSPSQIGMLEAYIGPALVELNYECLSDARLNFFEHILFLARNFGFKFKQLLKYHTVLGRLSVSPLEFEQD